MNKKELAEALNVSLTTIDRYISLGCPYERDGRNYVFDLDEVEQWRADNIISYHEDYSRDTRKEGVDGLFRIIMMYLPYVDMKAFISDVEAGRHRKLPKDIQRLLPQEYR